MRRIQFFFGVMISLFPIYVFAIQLTVPINEEKQLTLIVQLPNDFKSLQDFKNRNLNNKEIFFAPINQGEEEQKEMIMMIPMLKSKISAVTIVDKLTEQFKKTAQEISVIKERKETYDDFTHAGRLIIYKYKNEIELVNIYAVSGPENVVVLQYSIKVKNKAQVGLALNKILNFFHQGVKVRKQKLNAPKIKLKDLI